ncbi:MAG: hypothetical protein WKG32_20345 [Gemmatimonadaceae bacterium]
MFEELKRSLRDALGRATSPGEGRAVLAMMREAIVDAKVIVADLKSALVQTQQRLAVERDALETVRRRGRLAAEIKDQETSRIAAEHEHRHTERISVLERKLEAQQAELGLAEGEIEEMTRQLKSAAVTGGVGGSATRVTQAVAEAEAAATGEETSSLRRDMDRSARESRADQQLEELKRRMGR